MWSVREAQWRKTTSHLDSSHVMLSRFSCVWLFATPQTVAHQAPLSMAFSTQEYWKGLPGPPPGDLPNTQGLSLSLMCLLHCRWILHCWATGEGPWFKSRLQQMLCYWRSTYSSFCLWGHKCLSQEVCCVLFQGRGKLLLWLLKYQ